MDKTLSKDRLRLNSHSVGYFNLLVYTFADPEQGFNNESRSQESGKLFFLFTCVWYSGCLIKPSAILLELFG